MVTQRFVSSYYSLVNTDHFPFPFHFLQQYEVSWCLRDGYGTRLIPNGTIKGAHFVQTPDFVQITGTGDLTQLNIPKGDEGGELDPHGADGNGNPVGGLVFSSAFGTLEQIHEWTVRLFLFVCAGLADAIGV